MIGSRTAADRRPGDDAVLCAPVPFLAMPQAEPPTPKPDLTCLDFRTGLAVYAAERGRAEEMYNRVSNSPHKYIRGRLEERVTSNAIGVQMQADRDFQRFRQRPEWRTIEMACQRRYRDGLTSTTFDLLLADICHEVGTDFLNRPLAEFADMVSPKGNSNTAPPLSPVESPPHSCFERLIRFETDFRTQVRREWAKSGLNDRSEDVLSCLRPLWIIHGVWHNFVIGSLPEGDLTMLGIGYIDLMPEWRRLEEILTPPEVRRALMLTHDAPVLVAGMKTASYSEAGRQLLVDHANLFGSDQFERTNRWKNVPNQPFPTMGEAELRRFEQSMRNHPQWNFSGAMPAKSDSYTPDAAKPQTVTIQQIVQFADSKSVTKPSVRGLLESNDILPLNPKRSGAEPFLFVYSAVLPYLKSRFKHISWPETALPEGSPV